MSIDAQVHADAQETSAACARAILDVFSQKLASGRPHANIAVSGGSTPKLLFAELAKAKFDWTKAHIFWVDERGVPPTDSQSNYKLTKENLLDAAHIPAANIHRIQGELDPHVAAKLYVEDIVKFFGLKPGELPRFDIVHRGMGPDAHTASLFPGEPLIDDRTNIAGAAYVEKFKQWRVTLLPGVLMNAERTFMLVAGDDKAEPLEQVLYGSFEPKKYPCQIAVHNGHGVTWFLDKAAARLIQQSKGNASAP
jgi:6-phosphogluconolactonase